MAQRTPLDCGKCPRCGEETKRAYIASFPFDDDEQSCIEEQCKVCNFYMETTRTSSNAATSQAWSWEDEMCRKMLDPVQQRLSTLISGKVRNREPVQIDEVLEALEKLPKYRFSHLYVYLTQVQAREETEHARYMENLVASSQRNAGMIDSNDNDASASAYGTGAFSRTVDQAKALLRQIEEGLPRFRVHMEISCLGEEGEQKVLFVQAHDEVGARRQAGEWVLEHFPGVLGDPFREIEAIP